MTASGIKRKQMLNSERDASVRRLMKENVHLKKGLAELRVKHSQHDELIQSLFPSESLKLESAEPAVADQQCENEENFGDGMSVGREHTSSCSSKIEDLKCKLARVSTKCEYLEKQFAKEHESHPAALEQNKDQLKYDLEREDFVRDVANRVVKQLNEDNQNRLQQQQHNEQHSDENKKTRQTKEYYEGLLEKAKEEMEALREEVDKKLQDLIKTQNGYEDKQREVEELKEQLESERTSNKDEDDPEFSEGEEEEEMSNHSTDLQMKLDGKSSTSIGLQVNVMSSQMNEATKKIAELQRETRTLTQHLEDERKNCAYLQKQLVKNQQHGAMHPKLRSFETEHSYSKVSNANVTCASQRKWLKDRTLQCPNCKIECSVDHYKELLNHIDICFN